MWNSAHMHVGCVGGHRVRSVGSGCDMHDSPGTAVGSGVKVVHSCWVGPMCVQWVPPSHIGVLLYSGNNFVSVV